MLFILIITIIKVHHVQKRTLGPTAPCSTVQFIKIHIHHVS